MANDGQGSAFGVAQECLREPRHKGLIGQFKLSVFVAKVVELGGAQAIAGEVKGNHAVEVGVRLEVSGGEEMLFWIGRTQEFSPFLGDEGPLKVSLLWMALGVADSMASGKEDRGRSFLVEQAIEVYFGCRKGRVEIIVADQRSGGPVGVLVYEPLSERVDQVFGAQLGGVVAAVAGTPEFDLAGTCHLLFFGSHNALGIVGILL